MPRPRLRNLALLLLPLLLFAAACSDGDGDGGATTEVPTPEATAFPPDLQAQADELLHGTEEVRGLEATEPVAMNLISRAAATAYLRDSYTEEDNELLRIQGELFVLLGIYPQGTDIKDSLVGLLGGGVAGFYDPDLKAFYLLDDLGGLGSRATSTTIVHELTHALQDQHYDLNKRFKAVADDWDATTALTSLVEGDAVYTEHLYFGDALRPQPGCFAVPAYSQGSPPYALVREIYFWYDDGLCFLQTVLPELEGGLADLYDDPPVSTEQILHPDRYLADDRPVDVELPSIEAALGEGWNETKSSTFGEFALQNLLIPGLMDRARVQSAAAGWGGDRWLFYENGDANLAAAATLWESEDEADEFFAALMESVYNRASGRLPPQSEDRFSLTYDGQTWYALRSGDRVSFVVADDADAAQRVASALGF